MSTTTNNQTGGANGDSRGKKGGAQRKAGTPPRRMSPPVHVLAVPRPSPDAHVAAKGDPAMRPAYSASLEHTAAPALQAAEYRAAERQVAQHAHAAAMPGLIAEDDAATLPAGGMRRAEYLDRLEHVVIERAAAAFAGTQWSAEGCPWMAYWFGHYRAMDAAHLERAIHRYAPQAVGATSADQYVELVAARIGQGLARFVRLGTVANAPADAPAALPAGTGWRQVFAEAAQRRDAYAARLRQKSADDPAARAALRVVGDAIGQNLTVPPTAEQLDAAIENDGDVTSASAVPEMPVLTTPGPVELPVAARSGLERIREQLGQGNPLPADVRGRLNEVFGEDVGNLRVHTDADAARLAAQERALAFTVGNDIVFGAGQFRPGTPFGDGLIAHEAAHAMQQRGADHEEPAASVPALERDAERSTRGALARLLARGMQGMRGMAEAVRENTKPTLKSGLGLMRCSENDIGPSVPANNIIVPRADSTITTDAYLNLHQSEVVNVRVDASGKAEDAAAAILWAAIKKDNPDSDIKFAEVHAVVESQKWSSLEGFSAGEREYSVPIWALEAAKAEIAINRGKAGGIDTDINKLNATPGVAASIDAWASNYMMYTFDYTLGSNTPFIAPLRAGWDYQQHKADEARRAGYQSFSEYNDAKDRVLNHVRDKAVQQTLLALERSRQAINRESGRYFAGSSDLRAVFQALEPVRARARERDAIWEKFHAAFYHVPTEEQNELRANAYTQKFTFDAQNEKLLKSLGEKYPILASFLGYGERYDTIYLLEDAKTEGELLTLFQEASARRLTNIRTVIERITSDPDVVWGFDQLIDNSLTAMGIDKRSEVYALIKQKQSEEETKKMIRDFIIGLVMVGVTIATDGAASPFVIWLGVGIDLGLAVTSATIHLHEANTTAAAHTTDYNQAKSLTSAEPDYFSVALDIIGIVGSGANAAKAFRRVQSLIKEAAVDAKAARTLQQNIDTELRQYVHTPQDVEKLKQVLAKSDELAVSERGKLVRLKESEAPSAVGGSTSRQGAGKEAKANQTIPKKPDVPASHPSEPTGLEIPKSPDDIPALNPTDQFVAPKSEPPTVSADTSTVMSYGPLGLLPRAKLTQIREQAEAVRSELRAFINAHPNAATAIELEGKAAAIVKECDDLLSQSDSLLELANPSRITQLEKTLDDLHGGFGDYMHVMMPKTYGPAGASSAVNSNVTELELQDVDAVSRQNVGTLNTQGDGGSGIVGSDNVTSDSRPISNSAEGGGGTPPPQSGGHAESSGSGAAGGGEMSGADQGRGGFDPGSGESSFRSGSELSDSSPATKDTGNEGSGSELGGGASLNAEHPFAQRFEFASPTDYSAERPVGQRIQLGCKFERSGLRIHKVKPKKFQVWEVSTNARVGECTLNGSLLEFVVDTRSASSAKGGKIFDSLFDAFELDGRTIDGIYAKWYPSHPDNLNAFNEAILKGIDPDVAALEHTFTGHMAGKRGFSKVLIIEEKSPRNADGTYKYVDLIFELPDN